MLLVYHGLQEMILGNISCDGSGDSEDSGDWADLDGMNSWGKGLFATPLQTEHKDLVHEMKDTVDEKNEAYINSLLGDHPS